MKIEKAVITAAGRDQRTLPLQTLVDRDGVAKSAMEIIVEEALSTGVEDLCIVHGPGDEGSYEEALGPVNARLHFLEQREPRGYGHALSLARPFVGNEPFLHLVSDHLWVSRGEKRCAQQLVEIASREACTVSAVQPTREHLLRHFGTVGGRRLASDDLYEVDVVREKPSPTEAEMQLMIPGLRAGHYLCFFGMHVFSPTIFSLLDEELSAKQAEDSNAALSEALSRLAARERYLAFETSGMRQDLGSKYGTLFAQLGLALEGQERDEVLSRLVELLASRELRRP